MVGGIFLIYIEVVKVVFFELRNGGLNKCLFVSGRGSYV